MVTHPDMETSVEWQLDFTDVVCGDINFLRFSRLLDSSSSSSSPFPFLSFLFSWVFFLGWGYFLSDLPPKSAILSLVTSLNSFLLSGIHYFGSCFWSASLPLATMLRWSSTFISISIDILLSYNDLVTVLLLHELENKKIGGSHKPIHGSLKYCNRW